MEDTMKMFCKWLNIEINVPTTTKFPKGKFVWNVPDNQPYIRQGFVPVCRCYEGTTHVNADTFEFVFVGGWRNARIIMMAAGCTTVGIDTIEDMKKYTWDKNKYNRETVEMAIEIVKKFS